MLVLCTFEAHAKIPYPIKFTNGIMIDCRSDKLVEQEFNRQMNLRRDTWCPAKALTWRLISYLPAHGKAWFGPGVDSHLRMAPPIAERPIAATELVRPATGVVQ